MKKKIPLEVHEFLEPYLDKNGDNFHSITPNGFLLRFIDSDAESDFYFNVEQYKIDKVLQLLIDFKPESKTSLKNRKVWVKSVDLQTHFSKWLGLLEGYDNVKTVFDDPITKAYADEFFDEFELIEEDADKVPLSSKQVLLIDEHLENIETGLIKYITPENENEIKLIQGDVKILRENLTKKSKKWVVKQLSRIWGQVAKQGPKLIKEFLNETKKELIKQGVKYLLKGGVD